MGAKFKFVCGEPGCGRPAYSFDHEGPNGEPMPPYKCRACGPDSLKPGAGAPPVRLVVPESKK